MSIELLRKIKEAERNYQQKLKQAEQEKSQQSMKQRKKQF